MRYSARIIIAAIMYTAAVSSSAAGQTCAQLKAEIAKLQQTLNNEKIALNNCNNHPGSCSPGEASGFQQAIQIAQQEIQADQAQIPFTCAPPTPPDHVLLQGLEVVQAIQDEANSVTLVAAKQTWVRVYFDKTTGSRQITATLQAQQGSTTVNLQPQASITVDSSESLKTRRSNWSKTLNFAVPASVIASGTTVFTLSGVGDPSSTTSVICANCSNLMQVSFFNSPPLVVRAVGISYTFSSGGPQQTASPQPIDFQLLQSWLGRAYPVSTVTYSQTTVASNNAWPFSCNQTDAQLSAIRALDVQNGRDPHTHYYGLVSNQGGYMRGCAAGVPGMPDPSVTASGPTGPTNSGVVPVNVTGDMDGSFGDWYGGHELAHTFGRAHPGFCNGNSKDDLSYPFPNGQLSDGTDASFAGLDVGDSSNNIPLTVLWGGSDYDIMTYCNQPQWLSSYTYMAVRQRLLDENPGFKQKSGHPEGPTAPLAVPMVHVVATLNLTRHTGSIDYVTPLTSVAQPQIGLTGRAELVVRNVGGQEISRLPVALRLSTDIPEDEDQTALVDATLSFRPDMAEVDLVLDGNVLSRYKNVQTAPPSVTGLIARGLEGAAPTITWNQPPASAGQVTFIIQIPGSDGMWETIAVGLVANRLTLPAAHAQVSKLRVIASNGFRSSSPVVINLCPELMDQVAKLEAQIQELTLDRGEAVARPGSPQRSQILQQLNALRRQLTVVKIRLMQCQAQKQ